MLKVSVIVSLFNVENYIEPCLESLSKQEILPYQIILIDNSSTDKSIEKIRNFITGHPEMNIILLNETKKGIASARNKGLQYADGDIIAFTDSDCLPRKDWVKKMIELYETEKIDGVGGIAYLYNPLTLSEKIEALDMAIPRQLRKSVIDKKYDPFLSKFIMGFNASYRREVFKQIKELDELFTIAGDDIDFCIRAFERGFKLMAWHPEMVIWHLPRKSLKLYLKKIFIYAMSLSILFKKHFKNEMLIQFPIIGIKRIPFFTSVMITKDFLVRIFYILLIVVFYKSFISVLSIIAVILLTKSFISVLRRKEVIDNRISFFELFGISLLDLVRRATWVYGKIYGSIKNRSVYL